MKTVFVNSNIINLINESLIFEKLPKFIISDVENNKTTFGINKSFPDSHFLIDLYEKRFNEIIASVKSLKKIEDVKSTDINHALGEIINKCKDEERPYREKLEALCAKIIIDLFLIPEDSVSLEIKLLEDITINSQLIQFYGIDDKTDYSEDINSDEFNDEVSKRQVISSLNMGYGMLKSSKLKEYISEIYDINPKLVELYHRFLILTEYSLFTNSHEKMTEKQNLQIGSVELNISQIDEIPEIKSVGVIFPVLLCETIRGLMELFSSHGLPKDKKIASEILKRTDYLLAEPWYMRTGMSLWQIIFSQIDNLDEKIIPYLYRRICTLNANDFFILMKNVLSKNDEGRNMLSILIDKSKKDFDDCKQEKMDEPDTENSIIIDNYIREEEL